jgi:hypothetical protein
MWTGIRSVATLNMGVLKRFRGVDPNSFASRQLEDLPCRVRPYFGRHRRRRSKFSLFLTRKCSTAVALPGIGRYHFVLRVVFESVIASQRVEHHIGFAERGVDRVSVSVASP